MEDADPDPDPRGKYRRKFAQKVLKTLLIYLNLRLTGISSKLTLKSPPKRTKKSNIFHVNFVFRKIIFHADFYSLDPYADLCTVTATPRYRKGIDLFVPVEGAVARLALLETVSPNTRSNFT